MEVAVFRSRIPLVERAWIAEAPMIGARTNPGPGKASKRVWTQSEDKKKERRELCDGASR